MNLANDHEWKQYREQQRLAGNPQTLEDASLNFRDAVIALNRELVFALRIPQFVSWLAARASRTPEK